MIYLGDSSILALHQILDFPPKIGDPSLPQTVKVYCLINENFIFEIQTKI